MEATIRNEINVKQIKYLDSEESLQFKYLTLDFPKAGQALRENLSTVKTILEKLSFEQMNYVIQQVKEERNINLPGWKSPLSSNLFQIKTQTKPNIILESEGDITVALDTKVTESLQREGWIREILRHCQVLRKDTGLNVEDRINLAIATPSSQIRKAIEEYISFIKDETLALTVNITDHLDSSIKIREISLSEGTVQISLTKA